MNEVRHAVAGVAKNPLVGLDSSDMFPIVIGTTIADNEPEFKGIPPICRFNGEWLLRAHWNEVVAEGDVLEWYVQPQSGGRELLRYALQIALIVASVTTGFAAAVPYLIAANFAYNLLVPPRQPTQAAQTPGAGIFSVALAGNAARLDQPIWRNCGRVKITPPFACAPYTIYRSSNAADPTVDCDQYYYALFAVGIGDHALEQAFISKTPIGNFKDVLVASYLAPGVAPSTVRPNIFPSSEVTSAAVLDTEVYVGGFVACRPGDTVKRLNIDVEAPQGLGAQGAGGDNQRVQVTWRVETRQIDDFGSPLGAWVVLANEQRAGYTNTPQRWSVQYTLSAPIRCEVRVTRSNVMNTAASTRDGITWTGMWAELSRAAPLNPNVAHYEVVMRASKQLSSLTQRDFNLIVRAFVPTYDLTLKHFNYQAFSRNAMWWIVDALRSTVYGMGVDDSLIDLTTFYDMSKKLDARQDNFDYTFVTSMPVWDAIQLIARSCRCKVFRRAGFVYTVARDEYVDMPVTAFTTRNTQPKSMTMSTRTPAPDYSNGIIIEYQSNVMWDTAQIECPCPGFSVTDPASPRYNAALPPMDRPTYVTLDGVTGATHAEREGLFQAASGMLRTTTVGATVEMEGAIVPYMSLVRWQPQFIGYGQSGDVAFWDLASLVMGLTEPADFSGPNPVYLTLFRKDGSLTTPVIVSPGPTEYDIKLPVAPDFTLVVDSGTQDRPKYLLGPINTGDELVKLGPITDGGKANGAQLFNLIGLVDVPAVHSADSFLLPGSGPVQDPIDGSIRAANGGTAAPHPAVVKLTSHTIVSPHPNVTVAFYLLSNGGALGDSGVGGGIIPDWPGEWINTTDPSVIAQYECRASVGVDPAIIAMMSGMPLDVWLPLTTNRHWDFFRSVGEFTMPLTVDIRKIGATVIEATQVIYLHILGGDPRPPDSPPTG